MTPPKPGSEADKMSPAEFLVSPDKLTKIKRKASVPTITQGQAKRLCLEPVATVGDSTMTLYQQRVENTCDRLDIMVMITDTKDEVKKILKQ